VNFLGKEMNIPKNPQYFLNINYDGDYMTKIESTSRIHKTDTEVSNIITRNIK
jgi:hypothetical protein